MTQNQTLTLVRSAVSADLNEDAALRDEVFRQPEPVADFNFGARVARVFDDMLDRSVPFYQEIQRMIAEIARDFAVAGSSIYDLGCSTGTTLSNLASVIPLDVRLVGVDHSEDMLCRCREKLAKDGVRQDVRLINADLNQGVPIEHASLVAMVLTLQFIRPLHRDALLRNIHQGLNDNGCLILVEKLLGEHSLFNRTFIGYYYEMKKRNGYTELEIAQKREALENVLVPYTLMENREALARAGFRMIDVFFKWYNFGGIIAIK